MRWMFCSVILVECGKEKMVVPIKSIMADKMAITDARRMSTFRFLGSYPQFETQSTPGRRSRISSANRKLNGRFESIGDALFGVCTRP
jgi:hypothetical protein